MEPPDKQHGWRPFNTRPLGPSEALARLDELRRERDERAINPPGRWTGPHAKISTAPGSVPEGWCPTATDCRYWVMTESDRDQLEAIQSQLLEPLRARVQAILDRMERDPS